MEYLVDTNIYRCLVRELSIEKVKNLANHINEIEKEKGFKSSISIDVAMELISHLQIENSYCEECYKALCLLFHHSRRFKCETKEISWSFNPPLNQILTLFFFNEKPKGLEFFESFFDTISKITLNYNQENIKQYTDQILLIKQQIAFEKEQIHLGVIEFLKSINNNSVDWGYFKTNRDYRKKWFHFLENETSLIIVAEGLMERAFHLTDREYTRSLENLTRLDNFISIFYPAIFMYKLIFEQLGHGTLSLKNNQDKKWNTIIDISILFGILINKKKKNQVIVTNDQPIGATLKNYGMEKNVISLNEFKEIMRIDSII